MDRSLTIPSQGKDIDWSLCLLCQSNTNEKLTNPDNSCKSSKYDGCKSLETVLTILKDLNQLSSFPFDIVWSRLDNGSCIYDRNKAVNHRSCKKYFSESRLERAVKRAGAQAEGRNVSPKKTRQSSDSFDKNTCIFCSKTATRNNALFRVSTGHVSSRISAYAEKLKDSKLLAKILGVDYYITSYK